MLVILFTIVTINFCHFNFFYIALLGNVTIGICCAYLKVKLYMTVYKQINQNTLMLDLDMIFIFQSLKQKKIDLIFTPINSCLKIVDFLTLDISNTYFPSCYFIALVVFLLIFNFYLGKKCLAHMFLH